MHPFGNRSRVGVGPKVPGRGIIGEVSTDAPDEADLRPLDPRIRQLWWANGAIGALLLLSVAVVAALFAPTALAVGIGAVAGLNVISAAALPPLRYARWRYAVREDDIWVRQGLVWVTTTVVPFSRLQFVDTRQGPLDRMFGLATLVLHTAALGSATTIPGLALAEAEQLRERLALADPDVVSV